MTTTPKRKSMTLREFEALSADEFDALSESEKKLFYEYMDRENFPSPAEFYEYHLEDGYSFTELPYDEHEEN